MVSLTEDQWDFVQSAAQGAGATAEAVRKWRERSTVPWRWRYPVAEEAKRKNVALPETFLKPETAPAE